MTAWLDVPAARLSLGTREKVGLAAAFAHRPDLVVLDEPTNGLDPLAVVGDCASSSPRSPATGVQRSSPSPLRRGYPDRRPGRHPAPWTRYRLPALRVDPISNAASSRSCWPPTSPRAGHDLAEAGSVRAGGAEASRALVSRVAAVGTLVLVLVTTAGRIRREPDTRRRPTWARSGCPGHRSRMGGLHRPGHHERRHHLLPSRSAS